MNHTEVVYPSGRYELVMGTHVTSRCGVIEIEVEIEDVSTLYAKFLGDEIDKEIAPFKFAVYDTENREHILLTAKCYTIVRLTVEVDCKIRDDEDRTFDTQKFSFRIHHIIAPYNHPSCDAQRTVEPSAEYRSAIYLGIELRDTAFACHFRIRLDAESGGVGMGTNDVETALAERSLANVECVDGRVVLGDIKLVTSLHVGYSALCVDSLISFCIKSFRRFLDGKEINGRGIEEI
jgi:hypothetical protein